MVLLRKQVGCMRFSWPANFRERWHGGLPRSVPWNIWSSP